MDTFSTATARNRKDAWWRQRHGFDNINPSPEGCPNIDRKEVVTTVDRIGRNIGRRSRRK